MKAFQISTAEGFIRKYLENGDMGILFPSIEHYAKYG